MPPPGGKVSDKMAAELVAARQALDDAQKQWERTVWKALEEGGSYAAVARPVGMNHTTIFRLAKRLGWPPPDVQARWDDYQARFGTIYPHPSQLRADER